MHVRRQLLVRCWPTCPPPYHLTAAHPPALQTTTRTCKNGCQRTQAPLLPAHVAQTALTHVRQAMVCMAAEIAAGCHARCGHTNLLLVVVVVVEGARLLQRYQLTCAYTHVHGQRLIGAHPRQPLLRLVRKVRFSTGHELQQRTRSRCFQRHQCEAD